jgi:ATP synthase protein I
LTTPEPEHAPDSSPAVRDLPGLAAFGALGLSIAITVGIGVGLGIWADDAFHTSPLFLVIGLVLGCAAATATTVSLVRRYL